MTFTYDPGDGSVGTLRLMIPDSVETGAIFSDEELTGFLVLEGSDVRYAAAQALDCIASSQVLTLKVMELLDLKVDGAKVAAELRARAKSLREQSDSDASFDIAEQVTTPFAARERLWKQWERSGL